MSSDVEILRRRFRQLEAEERRATDERRQRALALADRAASLLKAEFAAQRVVLYGSLLRPGEFHLRSDIDLAAWGVRDYFRAVSCLLDLDPTIEVNLVPYDEVSPRLQAAIDREGVDL